MAKIDAEGLHDPERIYLASSLGAARKVEAVLDARGVDYVVQVEELGRTALFGTMRHAAGFYVNAGRAAYCREALTEAGLVHGIVDEGPVPEQLRDPSDE